MRNSITSLHPLLALSRVCMKSVFGQLRVRFVHSIQVAGSLTITDVVAEQMQGWRFDPDTRQLDLHLIPASANLLPFTCILRLLQGSLRAGHCSNYPQGCCWAGWSFRGSDGAEVQLGDVKAELSYQLRGFPYILGQWAKHTGKSLKLRRTFRYSDNGANLSLSALPVKADVRVRDFL